MPKMKADISSLFKLSDRNTDLKTEFLAGLTTFAAMSYIIAVNPAILSTTGMDKAGLVTVTALTSALSCFVMALLTNMPIAVAPAMGTNTYFAFIICAQMGLSWQSALSVTFYNGIFFLIISLTGYREKIIYAIPKPLLIGLQCGIGLFIMFLGLRGAGIIVQDSKNMLAVGDIVSPNGLFALLGFALMAGLVCRKVKGAIIFSILAMTILGFFVRGSDGDFIASPPDLLFSVPHGISQTFLALDWTYPFRDFRTALPVILTLLLLDMFDTIGTVVALGRRAGFMDDKGRMPKMGSILSADAIATIIGSLLGTSTATSFVESSAGIESGGRTGLTSIVVGLLFLLALFLSPLIGAIPSEAVSPALIMVGLMMLSGLADINSRDYAELIPAGLCMVMIMLSCRITEGFAFGIISYVIIRAAVGRGREIKPSTWALAAVMLLFLGLYHA